MPHDNDRLATRQHPRYEVDLTVRVRADGIDEEIALRVTDLSASGVFIGSDRPLPVGAEVQMQLHITGQDRTIEAKGIVARSVDPQRAATFHTDPGMGVAFVDPSPQLLAVIDEVVWTDRTDGFEPAESAPSDEDDEEVDTEDSWVPPERRPLEPENESPTIFDDVGPEPERHVDPTLPLSQRAGEGPRSPPPQAFPPVREPTISPEDDSDEIAPINKDEVEDAAPDDPATPSMNSIIQNVRDAKRKSDDRAKRMSKLSTGDAVAKISVVDMASQMKVYALCKQAVDEGYYLEALAGAYQLLEADPESRRYRSIMHLASGFHLRDEGKQPDALEHFQRAANLDPKCESAVRELRAARMPKKQRKGLLSRLRGDKD